MNKNVVAIFDGQAGDSGKGKVIAEYALENNPKAAIINHPPSTSHSCEINGKLLVFKSIPVSAVNPNVDLFLGSGTFINMDSLKRELIAHKDLLGEREVIAHPGIPLIERRHLEKISEAYGPGDGCGTEAALTEKILCGSELKHFKGYKNIKVVNLEEYFRRLKAYQTNNETILLEGSGGSSLDISHFSREL